MMEWIVSTSVLILVIVALRYILRGKISLRLQYALWALVLLRALVPLSFFSSPISIMNAVDRIDTTQFIVEDYTYSPAVENIEFVPYENRDPTASITTGDIVGYYPSDSDRQFPTVIVPNATVHEYETVQTAMEVQDVLRILWLCGAVLMALVFGCTNFKFGQSLHQSRKPLELHGSILPVFVCSGIETPCLFGFFRPAVYLTPGCEADQTVLRHVLAHEFTHYRHGDNIWAILRCVAVALHWYNPLVWLAAFLSMRDAELACDEGAIKRLGEAERASYGRTLIGMTCRSGNVRALALTATTMTGSKKGIKERIILIAKKPKMAVYTLVAVLLVAAIAVGCTFSGVEEDKAEADGFSPDYMNINNALSSLICEPVSDPAIVQEFYELYLSFETGQEVDKKGGTELILGFGSSESEEFDGCIVTSDGLVGRFESDRYVYYELENGLEIYDKIYAQYEKMQLDTLFSPTEVYISRSDLDKELVITDEHDVNELYVNFKVCSANATEIDESKVSTDNAIYVAFTDGETTRRVILYGDGCYSPEPEESERERRYYRLGSYDNCGTQGIYMLFDTYCNAHTMGYCGKYVPIVVITGAAEDWDLSGEVTTMVEYYNARIDLPHVSSMPAVSSTAAMWLLSQKGRFETVYLLNATDSTKRAEWLAEDLKLIADNVITDPAEVEAATGWTVLVEKQEGIPLYNNLMLRIDNSISMYEDPMLLGTASSLVQKRITELEEMGIEIVDAMLTGLAEIPCGGITEKGIGARMFLPEYRLKPVSLDGVFYEDIIMEGDWITERNAFGQTYLILCCGEYGFTGLSTKVTTHELETTYSTDEMIEKYGNAYLAACMETFAAVIENYAARMEAFYEYRHVFLYYASYEELAKYYAENVYPYEHYMGSVPVGDDPAAITDFKPVSNQLIAVSVTGDRLVGHMSTAVVPLQFEGNPYWGASNGYWGSGEYEGMLVIESFFELQSLGDGLWYCTGTGTGGFGGWGYIPMDFESSDAVLATLELWLGDMDGYEENILTLLPLIDWSTLERSSYDIDPGALFKAIEHAAIGNDDYYTDTYPDDQLYRDLYVMKTYFNTDGAYSEFLAEILLRQHEHDTAIFETALKYFSIDQQDTIMDAVAFARG